MTRTRPDWWSERQSAKAKRYAQWMSLLRTTQGCYVCGSHEGRLVHHHVDPSGKSSDLARMWGASLERWMDEVDKCVVLCWPCHKAEHAQPRDSYGRFKIRVGYTGQPK